MRDYIILNGVNSNTITGLLISKLPPITKPKIRTQTEEIDGRDGDIVTKLGYSAYDKELEIGLYGDFDIDDVIAYFNSEGTVTFSNEPDKFYNYQILDQIDYEKLIRFKKAKVRMHVQPFKYPLEETPVEITIQTVNDEGEEIDLDNTKEAPMTIALKGNGGKNLIDLSTATKTGWNIVMENPIEEAGTYTISLKEAPIKPGAVVFKDEISGANIGGYFVGYNFGNPLMSQTRDITQEQANARYIIYLGNGDEPIEDLKNKLQLEKGSTATDYEPYGASVTGDNSIEVCGKNLVNIHDNYIKRENATYSNITVSNNTLSFEITGSRSGYIGYIIPTTIGQTYTLSFNLTKGFIYTIELDNVISDISGNFGLERTTPYTYTATKKYLGVWLSGGNTTDNQASVSNLMLEKNNQATTYEAYKGASYPISLGSTKLNTGDSIQYITDNWYIVRVNETQEEITDATLIAQLEALANAISYDTTTHITQNNNDKPFILNATAEIQGSKEATVENEGNIYSKPTLDIEGSGTVGIYLEGNQIFTIDLSNSNECVIDTTKLEAYNPTTSELMNRQVTGDYSNFKLNAGDNQVEATGDITKVTISNYTRWL